MKEMDLQSVGGRIRKARADASLTAKELSERAGVSYAYLGMVERGERNPSDKLLGCVAEATGIPFGWLKTGDLNSVGSKSPKEGSFYIENIDAALFLSLIMHEEPPVSEEAIATILDVDQSTLKKIMNGTLKFNPKWRAAFTTLALRCDIPGILNKIRSVESFLERVNAESAEDETDSELIEVIKNSLSEKIPGDFVCLGQYYSVKDSAGIDRPKLKEINSGTGFPVKQFVFMQKPDSIRWNTMLFSELYEPMVEQLVLTAKNPEDPSKDNENEALIFMEEENFRSAISYAKECNYQNSPIVALILLDPDSMQVRDCTVV